jgi:hypothetical protein
MLERQAAVPERGRALSLPAEEGPMTQHPAALARSEPGGELPHRPAILERNTDDRLPPGFVRDMLNDSRLTDMLMDALETRVVALEEAAAARGVRRVAAAWRLSRSLRASIQHFSGGSFAERRCEAASTEWGSAQAR